MREWAQLWTVLFSLGQAALQAAAHQDNSPLPLRVIVTEDLHQMLGRECVFVLPEEYTSEAGSAAAGKTGETERVEKEAPAPFFLYSSLFQNQWKECCHHLGLEHDALASPALWIRDHIINIFLLLQDSHFPALNPAGNSTAAVFELTVDALATETISLTVDTREHGILVNARDNVVAWLHSIADDYFIVDTYSDSHVDMLWGEIVHKVGNAAAIQRQQDAHATYRVRVEGELREALPSVGEAHENTSCTLSTNVGLSAEAGSGGGEGEGVDKVTVGCEDRKDDYPPPPPQQTPHLTVISQYFGGDGTVMDWVLDLLGGRAGQRAKVAGEEGGNNRPYTYETVLDGSFSVVRNNALIIYYSEQCANPFASGGVADYALMDYLRRFDALGYAYGVVHLHDEGVSGCRAHYSRAKVVVRNFADPSFAVKPRPYIVSVGLGYGDGAGASREGEEKGLHQQDGHAGASREGEAEGRYQQTFDGIGDASEWRSAAQDCGSESCPDYHHLHRETSRSTTTSSSSSSSSGDNGSSTAKPYAVSFIGDTGSVMKGHRLAMAQAVASIPDHFLFETGKWADENGLSASEVAEVYASSRFVACPVGCKAAEPFFSGMNTMRMYEALEHGAVPILEDHGMENMSLLKERMQRLSKGMSLTWQESLRQANFSFSGTSPCGLYDGIDCSEGPEQPHEERWVPPFPVVKPDWSDLDAVLQPYLSSPAEFARLQARSMQWYRSFKSAMQEQVQQSVATLLLRLHPEAETQSGLQRGRQQQEPSGPPAGMHRHQWSPQLVGRDGVWGGYHEDAQGRFGAHYSPEEGVQATPVYRSFNASFYLQGWRVTE